MYRLCKAANYLNMSPMDLMEANVGWVEWAWMSMEIDAILSHPSPPVEQTAEPMLGSSNDPFVLVD